MTTTEVGSYTYFIPGDAADPFAGIATKGLAMPFGVFGRLPEHTLEDVLMSIKKHIAEVLDDVADDFLTGINPKTEIEETQPNWEVRFWDEQAALRFPFARVAEIGPDTVTNPANPRFFDHSQSVTVHLYPYPAPDSERAIVAGRRLKARMAQAIEEGAGRGEPFAFPLWDFGGVRAQPNDSYGLYGDSEARQPWDFIRIAGLSIDRLPDPEDDRYVAVIVTFRAMWRRVPSVPLGHLVESMRVTAHPR